MCVLSIKVPIQKKSGNLFNDPHIYIYIYIYISSTCPGNKGFPNSFAYCPLLQADLLNSIRCLHNADEYKSLLGSWHWCVHA